MKFNNKFLVAVFLLGFRFLGAMNDTDCVSINVRYNPIQMDTFCLPGGMTIGELVCHCLSIKRFEIPPAQAQFIKDRYFQYQSSFNNLCHMVCELCSFYPDVLCGNTAESREKTTTTLREIVASDRYTKS